MLDVLEMFVESTRTSYSNHYDILISIRSFSYDCSRVSAPNLVSSILNQHYGLPPLLDHSMPLLVTSIQYFVEHKQSGEESYSVVCQGLSSVTNIKLISPYF
jgi:hypothetical protein